MHCNEIIIIRDTSSPIGVGRDFWMIIDSLIIKLVILYGNHDSISNKIAY